MCYSVWIALLLLAVRYANKWNKATKANTSGLDAIAAAANAEVEKDKARKATSGDWIFLIGLSLLVSAISQSVGAAMNAGLANVGLDMFDKGTCTTVFVTVLGLICAMTPLGKLPAVEEMSNIYLYAVVSLLASTASVTDLLSAPMWVVYGMLVLVLHVVVMFILSKIFHWDLCMVSTASLANIGGSASAPIVATAYDASFAGIGVLMGVLGAAIAVFSNNLKYILACSSLSQIGFILVGTAALSLLGQHNALAAHGTVLYMMNHSLVKLTLFLLAGVVYCNTHALDLNQIRGFGRGKPLLHILFLCGACSLAGIPGFLGYISKTLVHESLVELAAESGSLGVTAVEWLFLFSGGLTAASGGIAASLIFGVLAALVGKSKDQN